MADLNVGKLTFDLTVNDAPFNAGLKRSQMTAASTSAKTSASLKGVSRDADAAGKSFTGMSSSVNKAALSLAALAAGAVALDFLRNSVNAASDLNEAMNISTLVFKENAEAIQEWAAGGAEAFGLSTTQAIQSAAGYANLFQNVGFEMDEASDKSQRLVEISADMASAFNTTVPDAIQAISAGLRGEAEPLRRYGVMLDDVTLKAKAMEMGLYSGTGTLSQYAKAQAAYNIVLEKTATIQGDFARTAEDPANATRILQAEVENLQASLGEDLLPIMKDLISTARDVVKWVGENKDAVMALAKVAAVIGGVTLAWKGVSKAIQLATAAQMAFNRQSAAGAGMGGMARRGGMAAGGALVGLTVAQQMVPGFVDNIADSHLGKVSSTESVLSEFLSTGNIQKVGIFGDRMKDLGDEVAKVINPENTGTLEGWGRRFEDFWGTMAGNGGGEGRNRVLEQVGAIDEAITQLIADGDIEQATAMYDQFIAAVTSQPGVTAEQAKALLTASSDAFSEYERSASDAATATDEATRAQGRMAAATENTKTALRDARDAAKAYRRAVRETAGEVLGGVDAFGGAPDTGDALGQDALLRRSAGSRDYMRQTAADMRELAKAGVSQATIDGLYEVEQSAPGTIRKIVSQGITAPFVQQLNTDFAERARFSEIIAKSLVLTERDAKRVAVGNARTMVAAQVAAYAEEAAAFQAGMANGSVAFGSAEWAAGNRAATAAFHAQQAGGVNTSTMTVRQMTVVANNPAEIVNATRKNRKHANTSGRRG